QQHRHRERTDARTGSRQRRRHRENNAPAADHSLTADSSGRHRKRRYSESHPTSARTANRRRSEFHRPNAFPSEPTAVLAASLSMVRNRVAGRFAACQYFFAQTTDSISDEFFLWQSSAIFSVTLGIC